MTTSPLVPTGPGHIRRGISQTSAAIGAFTDRYPFFGPSFYVLAITFFVAQIAVAYNWQSRAPLPGATVPDHPYGFFANTISDLGESAKFTYGDPAMWSPNHVWMNVAFILLGAVMIVGSPLVYQEFNEDTPAKIWVARVAFGAQIVAGAGAITVGLIPENTNSLGHEIGAGAAIAVGTFGVFLLGLTLPLPRRIRRFMLFCMPVSLVAILLYALHEYLGFGPGGMERIAAYPEVIWLIIFGFYISRSHYKHGSAHRPTAKRPLRLRLPAVLPAARRQQSYSAQIRPVGGTGPKRTFTTEGPIPPGLALSDDGVISGAPNRWGFRRMKVAVNDGTTTAHKTYILAIGR
jgi:hypothetical membrane protein